MYEQELIKLLAEANEYLQSAKNHLAKQQKVLSDAETLVIDARHFADKVKEDLRIYRATTVKHEVSAHDQEIIDFRNTHPELCAEAKERDRLR